MKKLYINLGWVSVLCFASLSYAFSHDGSPGDFGNEQSPYVAESCKTQILERWQTSMDLYRKPAESEGHELTISNPEWIFAKSRPEVLAIVSKVEKTGFVKKVFGVYQFKSSEDQSECRVKTLSVEQVSVNAPINLEQVSSGLSRSHESEVSLSQLD